jgi:hypothetical protein
MILIAAYFMISALVTPQFAEAGRVYRIAANARAKTSDGFAGWTVAGVSLALLAGGFFAERHGIQSAKRRDFQALPRGHGGGAE